MTDLSSYETSPEPTPAVDRLFDLTHRQQELVDMVGLVYGQHAKWPTFYYVEAMLRRKGLDATDILDSLPSLALMQTMRYSAVSCSPARPIPPESEVRLSVLGVWHCQLTRPMASTFLNLLRAMQESQGSERLDPFEIHQTPVLLSGLWQQIQMPPPPVEETVLGLLRHEIPTGAANPYPTEDGWMLIIPPDILRFNDAATVRGYVDWLVELYGTPPREEPARPPSPFSLVAAIDYLDTVWQLAFGNPLVRLRGAERTAQLSFEARTHEEFASRMSALGEVVARFDIQVNKQMEEADPPQLDRIPKRLWVFLHDKLPSESWPRIEDAIIQLNAALTIRHGGQHADAAAKAAAAHSLLGLAYPIVDLQAAWRGVSDVAVHSFNDIREEIQAASMGVEDPLEEDLRD